MDLIQNCRRLKAGYPNTWFQICCPCKRSCIRMIVILFLVVLFTAQVFFYKMSNSSVSLNLTNISKVQDVLSDFKENRSQFNLPNLIPIDIHRIQRNIEERNSQQIVYNRNVFGQLEEDAVVIVIQVHKRIEYLRHLIDSFSHVANISQTLLVFSHDFYDEELNNLAKSIDFCKVIQIFYPYSIQSHPNDFPGEDPNDCPRNIGKFKAIEQKCNNALHPDKYGNYREAKFTQIKHHWWWKVNRVMDQLELTKRHKGLFVFLEEDHYVAEDFIYFLKLMEKTSHEFCRDCGIFALGTHTESNADYNKVEVTSWLSNLGMAFNRSTWSRIKKCAVEFCKYDDYNWDWSLQYVSYSCIHPKLRAMIPKGSRVLHVGECGVHHNNKDCNPNKAVTKARLLLESAKTQLYPDSLIISHISEDSKMKKENGGWGDVRDHELCINMTLS